MKSVGKEDEEDEEERAGSPQLEADLAFEIILEVVTSVMQKYLFSQDLSSRWVREPGVKTRSVTVDQLHIIDKNGAVADLRYFHFIRVFLPILILSLQ